MTTVGDAHVARAAYFARVDAVTLAVDEDDDEEEDRAVGTPSGRRRRHRHRCDDDDAVSLETLPPVFPSLTDAVVRAVRLAKATPKPSDPVAAIRAVARDGRARRLAAAAKAAKAAATAIAAATTTVAREPVETDAFDDGAFDDVDAMETDPSPARDAETRTNEATEEQDDGVYGLLARAARAERAERATSLPSTYALQEVRASDPTCDDLVKLSLEFAREDPRVGSLAGGLGAAVAHVLRDDLGVAVGYTLTHENHAPEWDLSRAVALPPRLAHVFITRARRARGLGTALVDWWRRRFALRCAFFAVDAPNDAIARALRRIECSLATTRSGHDASSVHYVAPNARSP